MLLPIDTVGLASLPRPVVQNQKWC